MTKTTTEAEPKYDFGEMLRPDMQVGRAVHDERIRFPEDKNCGGTIGGGTTEEITKFFESIH